MGLKMRNEMVKRKQKLLIRFRLFVAKFLLMSIDIIMVVMVRICSLQYFQVLLNFSFTSWMFVVGINRSRYLLTWSQEQLFVSLIRYIETGLEVHGTVSSCRDSSWQRFLLAASVFFWLKSNLGKCRPCLRNF